MFGVDLTVIYNVSISQRLDPYIAKHQQEGRVQVHNWESLLPGTWYYAQKTLIIDCIYRYMYLSEYIIVKDLDEIIVPRGNYTTLVELLEK